MKKAILSTLSLMLCLQAWCATPKEIVAQLRDNPCAHYMVLGKQMVGMLGAVGNEFHQEFLQQIDSVCVLSLDECDEATLQLFDQHVAQLDSTVYQPMLDTTEDGEHITISAKMQGDIVTELPMVVRDDESAQLVVVYGRINPADVNKFVDLM